MQWQRIGLILFLVGCTGSGDSIDSGESSDSSNGTETGSDTQTPAVDADGDGYPYGEDCKTRTTSILRDRNPYDSIDQDRDGMT